MQVARDTVIGSYVVEALLGKGGMASVYRVRHVTLGTPCALKLLDLPHPDIRERLLDEGRAQLGLRHPNVVAVFDVVEHDGCPGLVMEFVDGPSLHQLIHTEGVPADVRDALVAGIVHGVRAAHRIGLVHRDLKPANVLVARTDDRLTPKIADFGLAKVIGGSASGLQTRSGALLGTPVYMAPEQVRNAKEVDHRADIYALGVMTYEIATRRLPIDTEDLIELFARAVGRDYPRPRELAPDLTEAQERAILGALEPHPDDRIPDCDTLLAVWRGQVAWTPGQGGVDSARTSPFDRSYLDRVAKLGAGDGVVDTLPVQPREPQGDETEELPVVPPAPALTRSRRTLYVVGGGAAVALGLVLGVGGVVLAVVVVATMMGAPSPEPVAALPEPVVGPSPVAIAPTPLPVAAPPGPASPAPPVSAAPPAPPPPPPPPQEGHVRLQTGGRQTATVWLVANGREMAPGRLPVGTYRVEAEFGGLKRMDMDLEVRVVAGQTVTLTCNTDLATCKVE